MDERLLDDLRRELVGRSWLYDDPGSHQAGVEDTFDALRDVLADRRGGPSPVSPTRAPATRARRHVG